MRIKRRKRPKKNHRNLNLVYFAPSLLTVANIYFGFVSINFSIKGKFDLAALFIIFSAIMDLLDGRLARALRISSPIGRELDSLSDVVSFGIAPSLMIYLWGLRYLPKLGFLIAFVYLVGGTLRLARFNVLASRGVVAKKYFEGLPIPSAAMVPVSIVLYFKQPFNLPVFIPVLAGVIFLLPFLMVSRIKYRSFKDVNLKSREHYLNVLLFALVLSALAAWPRYTVFYLTSAYVLSGPARALFFVLRRKPKEQEHGLQT